MADNELDFSNLDGVDSIDWSDVESELQQNKEMINSEASGDGEGGGGAGDTSSDGIATGQLVTTDFLMDIPLRLRVEVGTTQMLIKNILDFDINSIIELDKDLGEPMEIFINDKLVAKGEVIIQNEKFGLRITEIMNESERLSTLKS